MSVATRPHFDRMHSGLGWSRSDSGVPSSVWIGLLPNPGCQIVRSSTREELTTGADFHSSRHGDMMSAGQMSVQRGLRESRQFCSHYAGNFIKSTAPNQWPGIILSTSTTGLLMERALFPFCWFSNVWGNHQIQVAQTEFIISTTYCIYNSHNCRGTFYVICVQKNMPSSNAVCRKINHNNEKMHTI